MITKEELRQLLMSTETFRVERTVSTGDMDKFQEAICAFSNDLPGSKKNGYMIIGVHDNGKLSGLKVDDNLMKKISGIRSDGNILPLPVMSVEAFHFPEGDLLVAEGTPCFTAKIDDIDTKYIKEEYLSTMFDAKLLASDQRDITEQLASLHLYDPTHNCPTYAALVLFGRNPKFFIPGTYLQYVRSQSQIAP